MTEHRPPVQPSAATGAGARQSPGRCPHCGRWRPSDAPQGLCPFCVAATVLRAEVANQDEGPCQVPLSGDSERAEIRQVRIGGYEVGEELGRGGMGVVYRARQVGADRYVALKVLDGSFAAPAEATERFLREAKVVAGLAHRGIVRLYEVGRDAGHPYFSMELVEGRTLEAMVRDGPLVAGTAARLLAKISRAVAYAHEHHVVHRDLKPSNVLVDSEGEPRVTDFGLARRLDVGDSLTWTRQTLGTPAYMAPEQVGAGKTLPEAANDIYALGAMLYRVLTGRPPFQAGTLEALLLQIVEVEPVPVRVLNPTVPPDLEAICHRCLEKQPRRRYATAAALADDLERFLDGHSVAARRVTPLNRWVRRCQRHPWVSSLAVAFGLAVLGGALGVFWQWRHAERARSEAAQVSVRLQDLVNRLRLQRAEEFAQRGQNRLALAHLSRVLRDEPADRVAPAQVVHLLRSGCCAIPVRESIETTPHLNAAALSPDGRRVAIASWDGYARVFDLDRGVVITPPLRHDKAVIRVTFSQDGKQLASSSPDGTARVWDVQTGAVRAGPLRHEGNVLQVAFSPDGSCLATTCEIRDTQRHEVALWQLASGQLRFPTYASAHYFHAIRFSPDGAQLAAASTDQRVHVLDARTGRVRGLLPHDSAVTGLCFSPDGQRLVSGSADGTVRVWDAVSLAGVGGPLVHEGPVVNVEFSRDGTCLLTSSREGALRVSEAGSGEPRWSALPICRPLQLAALDPVGTRVMAADAEGVVRLWDTGMPPPLHVEFRAGGPLVLGEFTPDGSGLVTVGENGRVQVWQTPVAGAPPVRLALGSPSVAAAFGPRPDEVSVITRQASVVRWDRRTGERFPHVADEAGPVVAASISPQGNRALLHRSPHEMALWNLEDGKPLATGLNLAVGEAEPAFSPGGAWLAFRNADGAIEVLDVLRGQRVPGQLPIDHRRLVQRLEFSADGRWLLVNVQNAPGWLWRWRSADPSPRPVNFYDPGSAGFSPDGQCLAVSDPGGAVHLLDVETGLPLRPFLRHPNTVRLVRFSPDGRKLITLAADNSLRCWSVADGTMAAPPMHVEGAVERIEISPDSRSLLAFSGGRFLSIRDLATGEARWPAVEIADGLVLARFLGSGGEWVAVTSDGTAVVRDTASGHLLCGPFVHGSAISAADIASDGRALLMAGVDQSVTVWEILVPPAPAPSWLPEFAEALAGARLDAGDALVPVDPARVLEIKRRLGRAVGQDFWTQWAAWFFRDRDEPGDGPFATP